MSLFKRGYKNRFENYREESLFYAAYKMHAKILNRRLKIIAEELIGEEQSGFRKDIFGNIWKI